LAEHEHVKQDGEVHRPVLGYSEEEVSIVEDNQVDHQLMGEGERERG